MQRLEMNNWFHEISIGKLLSTPDQFWLAPILFIKLLLTLDFTGYWQYRRVSALSLGITKHKVVIYKIWRVPFVLPQILSLLSLEAGQKTSWDREGSSLFYFVQTGEIFWLGAIINDDVMICQDSNCPTQNHNHMRNDTIDTTPTHSQLMYNST